MTCSMCTVRCQNEWCDFSNGVNEMKWFIMIALLASCGSKNKVIVSGGVTTPTEFNVNHKLSVDTSQFEESCTNKYKDVDNSVERSEKIEECISEKERIVAELLKALTANPPEGE